MKKPESVPVTSKLLKKLKKIAHEVDADPTLYNKVEGLWQFVFAATRAMAELETANVLLARRVEVLEAHQAPSSVTRDRSASDT